MKIKIKKQGGKVEGGGGGREGPASEAAVEKSGTKFLNILLTIEWRRKEKLRRRCTVMMLVGYRSLINGLDLF